MPVNVWHTLRQLVLPAHLYQQANEIVVLLCAASLLSRQPDSSLVLFINDRPTLI